ncbi:hypothetical protein MASR2M78_07380 [Treponema sp.]
MLKFTIITKLISNKRPQGLFIKSLILLFCLLPAFALVSCAADSNLGTEQSLEEFVEEPAWVGLHPDEYRNTVLKARHQRDPILALYRDAGSRDEVVAFFEAIIHSKKLASMILAQADAYDVSPSLAFALSWEESRFNTNAVNKNRSSIDRGLFQLNSKSFPKLTEKDFFNPELNTRYAIAHLRWCLDLAGSEVAGLAMYNAGTTRVRSNGTPKTTLDYVSRILAFRDGVKDLFDRDLAIRWVVANNGEIKPASTKKNPEVRLAAARFPILNASR